MKIRTVLTLTALVAATGVALAGESNPSAQRPSDKVKAATQDIVQYTQSQNNFKTFNTILKATGLLETLKGQRPYTVFAPNDEAFAALPAGTVEELLKPENKERLTEIVKYHVLPGRILQRDLTTMQESSQTLLGQTFFVRMENDQYQVGSDMRMMATIVTPEVYATNGIVHVINGVMIPRQ